MTDSRLCPACGTPIEPRRTPGNPRVWCSEACRVWNHIQCTKGKRQEATRIAKADRRCAQCAVGISHRRANAKYCSKRCSEIASGKRLPEALPSARCALSECGITFEPWRTGQRCCSEKHSKLLYNRESRADGRQKPGEWNDKRRDSYHRRRALKKAASTGTPVLFAEIAERDRWRCCICKKAVDPKVKWPHSKSPSLDHLVPLSKGGAHDPSNVALAHLGCNSAKNNRGGGEQLLLIG